uniref:Calponin n=1 Tax=Mizuhopecten yessoensis TaxID=6573 RepID=A0A0A1GUN4_MIZYE|nr:calponin [Mizuhopecten yessoensis]
MSDRMKPMGMDRALTSKLGAKYDSSSEQEVRLWIKDVTGDIIEEGPANMERALKNGIILNKLLIKLYEGTPNLPPEAQKFKPSFSESEVAFKQMENIEKFLKGAKCYGLTDNSLFQTVDLYEGRNMAMVIATILQVGTEAQRHEFSGSTAGSKPTTAHRRNFSYEQLKSGHGTVGLQSGSNKFASQKGMTSMGAVRHISDIRADDQVPEGQSMLTLQAGTNRFASQKGMAMGAVRHIADIRADQFDPRSAGDISLQSGTNKFASQKGMTSMGAVRHVSDIRADDACKEGQSMIQLQSGTNQFASQKGMTSMGAVRHISDIRADDLCREATSTTSLQYGTNRFDSQKGMYPMGSQRHVSDIPVRDLAEDSRPKSSYMDSPHEMDM